MTCTIKTGRALAAVVQTALIAVGCFNTPEPSSAQSSKSVNEAKHSMASVHRAAERGHKVTHILKDDTKRDASFDEFCHNLQAAAKKRDKEFVSDVLSPEISMQLGGARGKRAFLEEWQNLVPESAFWTFLEKSISHGAQYDIETQEFHAPAISFEDSHSDLPQCIAWNKTSTLRAKPQQNATPVKKVFDEQLTMLEPKVPEPVTAQWIKAKCKDGTVGYIENAEIYAAYDEFAVFAKRNDKWCITWFGYAGL